MNLVKTSVPGFSKDKKSGLLINTDEGKLQTILALRSRSRENKDLQKRIQILEGEIRRIKVHLGIE